MSGTKPSCVKKAFPVYQERLTNSAKLNPVSMAPSISLNAGTTAIAATVYLSGILQYAHAL